MKGNKGFTLIELIVVIVILGILAVIAAPKFIDLQSDARIAALNGLKASVASATTLVHGKALTTGQDSVADGYVKINGKYTATCYGYPCAKITDTTQGSSSTAKNQGFGAILDIDALPSCSSFTVASTDWCEVVTENASVKLYNASYWASNRTTQPACYVQYTPATATTSLPSVTIVSTGC